MTTEHALHRRTGGPTVVRDQLARLVELAASPAITVRVVPAAVDHGRLRHRLPAHLRHTTVVVEQTQLTVHYADEPEPGAASPDTWPDWSGTH